MKNILLRFLWVIVLVLLGLGIGVWKIAQVESSPVFFKSGVWMGSQNLPLGKNDMLTAQITVFALFALPAEEAVYLFAIKDAQNEKLSGDSHYILRGNVNDLSAKYWSITCYGTDQYLIDNPDDRYSFNRKNVVTDSAGNFDIHLSASRESVNWLPVKKGNSFRLVLRLYGTTDQYRSALREAKLPSLIKQRKQP